MASFEFTVSTISEDEGFVGEIVDRTPIFSAAIGRPIESIYRQRMGQSTAS